MPLPTFFFPYRWNHLQRNTPTHKKTGKVTRKMTGKRRFFLFGEDLTLKLKHCPRREFSNVKHAWQTLHPTENFYEMTRSSTKKAWRENHPHLDAEPFDMYKDTSDEEKKAYQNSDEWKMALKVFNEENEKWTKLVKEIKADIGLETQFLEDVQGFKKRLRLARRRNLTMCRM